MSLSLDSPCFDEDTRAKVVEVAHIKISKDCICENQSLVNEYLENMKESKAMSCIKRLPAALAFLSAALDQDLETLLDWLGTNGFNDQHSKEEKKAILFIRLVLTDFYANCMKPPLVNTVNERTPFVEYLIPVFKYYSAVYQDINFQWCEKGLKGNSCLKYFNLEEKGKKRLADGIGYVVADNTERMLIESSGEDNEEHKKEDTIKLLECNKNHWGFVYAREARIPRTWDTRFRWLKVFDLMLCTKDKLEEQQVLAKALEKEENGWIEVPPGESIDDMFNS
ncbi:hypothetical protein G6F43_012149 [Rhizopus delemar]|nr:hypothetical protein G6F43_012149 [Rhizopus delemar]